jgi:hypothetical protein
MLVKLQSRPDDLELRRLAAEALDAEGSPDEAAEILTPFVNLTGHDDDVGLPCLCKACLAKAGTTADSNGMAFVRSFAVVGNRVLHYWMLEDQVSSRAEVREGVTDALRARLSYVKANRR